MECHGGRCGKEKKPQKTQKKQRKNSPPPQAVAPPPPTACLSPGVCCNPEDFAPGRGWLGSRPRTARMLVYLDGGLCQMCPEGVSRRSELVFSSVNWCTPAALLCHQTAHLKLSHSREESLQVLLVSVARAQSEGPSGCQACSRFSFLRR